MLVCGEFGDKSQITAIVLSATYNPYSVIIGGSLVSSCFIKCLGTDFMCSSGNNGGSNDLADNEREVSECDRWYFVHRVWNIHVGNQYYS